MCENSDSHELKRYWASAEVTCLEGADFHGKLIGGFMYAFMMAKDVRDALSQLTAALDEAHFGIVEVEFIARYEDVPWETEEQKKHHDGLADEAQQHGEVVFGALVGYSKT